MNWRILLFFVFLNCLGFGQNYVLKPYSVTEGLPQSQVYDIIEDHNGQLWFATRGGGVARFNGNDFKVFTTNDGLVNNFVSSLFQDSKQNVWIGTSNGVSQYNGIRFRNFFLEGQNFPVTVSSISEQNGNLFLGTSNGVYERRNKKFVNITNELDLPGSSVTDVFFDKFNVLWVTHDKGLSMIDGDSIVHYTGDLIKGSYPQCIAQSKSGEVWCGTYGKGVFRYYGNTQKQIESLNGLIVLNILPEGDWLWISTLKNGVLKYNKKNEKTIRLQHSDQMPTKNCRLTFKDSWGGYWIGTSGGGVVKYALSPIKSFTNENGLKGNYIYALAASSDSGMWVSTGKKKLLKYKNGEFEEYGVERNIYSLKIKALFEDSKNRLWIGTEGEGLMMYENGKSRFFKSGKHLGSNFIKDVLEDRKGNIWVATSNGITKFSPELKNRFQYSSRNKNIHFNRVNSLWEDRGGNIWYGTHGKGLGVIKKKGYEVYNIKKGLSSNIIRDLTEDRKGNLFIATAGMGIDVISPYAKQKDVINISLENGLSSINIYNVHCDSNNTLWAGSDKGVDKVLNPELPQREVSNYGFAEGFSGVENTFGAVDEDLNGELWWGTINGLMKSAFVTKEEVVMPPKLSFASVNIYYQNIQGTAYEPNILNWYASNNLALAYKDNHIGFQLSGADLKQPNGIKYKWRLDGGSGRWTPASKQSEIYLSNLSPGNYIFQAIAVNKNGVESKPLDFYFIVKAPFYFTLWFWCGVLALLVFGIIVFLKTRIQKVKQKAKEVNDRLRLEKEVLEMEQKALRLQMNPHFIFNALNAIQDQIRENNNKNARHSLMKFSKLMRQILEHSMEERITLEQEVALIENYLSIEKLTRDNAFEFSIEVAEGIDDEEEGIPPMLIQPFLENAIIHGIASKGDVGEVKVSFSIQNDALFVEIKDNGVGREKAKELKAQFQQQHKSVALDVIQNRLNNLSNSTVKSSYSISDIIGNDNEIVGTVVSLTISRGVVF